MQMILALWIFFAYVFPYVQNADLLFSVSPPGDAGVGGSFVCRCFGPAGLTGSCVTADLEQQPFVSQCRGSHSFPRNT